MEWHSKWNWAFSIWHRFCRWSKYIIAHYGFFFCGWKLSKSFDNWHTQKTSMRFVVNPYRYSTRFIKHLVSILFMVFQCGKKYILIRTFKALAKCISVLVAGFLMIATIFESRFGSRTISIYIQIGQKQITKMLRSNFHSF